MTDPPHDLQLTIDFVNTLDADNDSDALNTTGGLAEWLTARGLMSASDSPEAPSQTDRQRALDLREALRSLMFANNGGPRDEQAAHTLELAARRGDLGVHFTPDGTMNLAPEAQGIPGALARVLAPVAHAIDDGSWQRVKACRKPDCLWAFYDRSRNRSGVWCEMAVCGNRTKVRAYRQRSPHEPS